MFIQTIEWLDMYNNFRRIIRIEPVSCFAKSMAFLQKLLDYLDDRDQDYLIKVKFKGLRLYSKQSIGRE